MSEIHDQITAKRAELDGLLAQAESEARAVEVAAQAERINRVAEAIGADPQKTADLLHRVSVNAWFSVAYLLDVIESGMTSTDAAQEA